MEQLGLMDMLNLMPEDVIHHCIKPFLRPEVLVWLNKENYDRYHDRVKDLIPSANYESYIRDMVRHDCAMVLGKLIDENFDKWKKMKKYYFKYMIFKNYLCFLMFLCVENGAVKCQRTLHEKASAVLGEKWHKNVRIRNCRWSN
tara:strand:- start:17 stop:448 length:432 start_codon:yes stop_codon:yes gene_type:complete